MRRILRFSLLFVMLRNICKVYTTAGPELTKFRPLRNQNTYTLAR